MRITSAIILIILFSVISLSQEYFYSFENTYSDWDTTGIDLELGDTTIVWSIHPSDEVAIDSSYSLRFHLESYNDAGKIWIQKPFNVGKQKDYIVRLTYKFATRDFGMANLWTIIAGVHLSPPDTAEELIFQDHTGNGFDFDTGYIWLEKNYEFKINSDTSSELWIATGIWGNWEAARTYFIDSLSVHIEEEDPSNINENEDVIKEYRLCQNYPNPFNPSTTIHFEHPRESHISLKIYNMIGQEVMVVLNEGRNAGKYDVPVNGSSLSGGVYFYRLQAAGFVDTKKFIIIK